MRAHEIAIENTKKVLGSASKSGKGDTTRKESKQLAEKTFVVRPHQRARLLSAETRASSLAAPHPETRVIDKIYKEETIRAQKPTRRQKGKRQLDRRGSGDHSKNGILHDHSAGRAPT
eukprot:6181698-Pleurochrysis_carterae.AAC.1